MTLRDKILFVLVALEKQPTAEPPSEARDRSSQFIAPNILDVFGTIMTDPSVVTPEEVALFNKLLGHCKRWRPDLRWPVDLVN